MLTAAIYAAILIYTLIPPSVDRSVPLRLTDLATVVACALDATALGLCVHLLLGLGAGAQALISPVLKSPSFPHYEFLVLGDYHFVEGSHLPHLGTWARRGRSYYIVVVVTAVWKTSTFNSLPEPTTAS